MQKWLGKILIGLVIIYCFDNSFGQEQIKKTNWEHIETKKIDDARYTYKRKVNYVFKESNGFVKYNPVSLVLGGLLYAYQKVISQQLLSECPYSLSCSSFSGVSIKKFGFIKGVFLSADRLTRCNSMAVKDIHSIDMNEKGKINDSPERYTYKKAH